MNRLDTLVDEFSQAVEQDDEGVFFEKLDRLLVAVSENIAEAINPVKEASAPILICILRRYADQIGKVYPDAEEVAKEFHNVLGTAAFVIPMEGGKPNAGMDDGAPMDDADSDAGGAGRIG